LAWGGRIRSYIQNIPIKRDDKPGLKGTRRSKGDPVCSYWLEPTTGSAQAAKPEDSSRGHDREEL